MLILALKFCAGAPGPIAPPGRQAPLLRCRHRPGSLMGGVPSAGRGVVRTGRASGCDARFDAARDPKVSNPHAEFLYEDGRWFVVATASTNGTIIEGKRVSKAPLRQGEEVQIGAGGPLVRVEFDAQEGMGGAMKTEAVSLQDLSKYLKSKPLPRIDDTSELSAISTGLRESSDTPTARLAE